MSARLEYSRDELFAEHPYAQRLEFFGKRLHGGLMADGTYRSPRTLHRRPAIDAWKKRLTDAGQPTSLIDESAVPSFFPNIPQTKLLLANGVVEPVRRIFTQTASMEANGNAGLDAIPKPDLEPLLKESIRGTTLAHLYKGLIEAQGRDEAGYGEEGGHDTMWSVARDLGFAPSAADAPAPLPAAQQGAVLARASGKAVPCFHPEIPRPLEAMLHSLITLLVMEVFAESTMSWAKAVLSDPAVSLDPTGATVISYIQHDEKIHVDYLTSMMLELRERTFLTDGGELPGAPIIDEIAQRMTRVSASDRAVAARRVRYQQIKEALATEPEGERILYEFRQLSDVALPET